MVPCAIEYFKPITRSALFGKRVGLMARSWTILANVKKDSQYMFGLVMKSMRKGFLDAGITGLTDNLDPNLTWLPSGNARWTRYSTKPLDENSYNF